MKTINKIDDDKDLRSFKDFELPPGHKLLTDNSSWKTIAAERGGAWCITTLLYEAGRWVNVSGETVSKADVTKLHEMQIKEASA